NSGRNVSAFWKVERIRHRDDHRGHRFELKFTVAPVKDFQLDENAIVNRSFIIRDEDYPRYFGTVSPNAIPMTKRNDQTTPSQDRAIFDPVYPYHPQYAHTRYYSRPTQSSLTLGEYLIQSLFSSADTTPKVQHHHYMSSSGMKLGSAFNRIKFPDTITTSTSPKFYHHIHFQRPSMAPLAPTAPPSPPMTNDVQTSTTNFAQQDFSKAVDLRGTTTETLEAKPNTENTVVAPRPMIQPIQPQVVPIQMFRYPPPLVAFQPVGNYHHPLQTPQPLAQASQQQPQISAVSPIPQQSNPPPLQPLPPNLVQSIPIFNPQGQVMLNHIPVSPNHMVSVSQPPIAIPVHVQLIPSQNQLYAPPQSDGLHPIPIRLLPAAPVPMYSPVNPYLGPHPAYVATKHPNQTHLPHFPFYSPNSIPTTLKYTAIKYTPQPSTSPLASPTASYHRYSSLPTVQASPAGYREKFTAPQFRPAAVSSTAAPSPVSKLPDPEPTGNNAVSPKFQSFGIENAVTPKATSAYPASVTASGGGDNPQYTPSLGHSSSVQGALYSNFIDDKGAVSESGRLYSDSYNLNLTTPISITTPAPAMSFTRFASYTSGPHKVPSPTIVPPQLETPISSTLKSYHYINHHDNYEFVPSRVVELAHVKKGKKQGKRKNPNNNNSNNHHHVTVTSHKPLKFSEAPDFATHRPESQLSVQLPPPATSTFYGTPKHNQKVQKPKNYSTLPYSSSTTPFPTSLTTPASTTFGTSASPIPALSEATPSSTAGTSTTASVSSTTATTEKPFTAYQSAQPITRSNDVITRKSDDINLITTVRPRLVIKTVYKPFSSTTQQIITNSMMGQYSHMVTEKPALKWVPKRPRSRKQGRVPSNNNNDSAGASSSASIEQISSEHALRTQTAAPAPQITSRASFENQVNRLRSRGRSRYNHPRVTTPINPPAQQQHHNHYPMRTAHHRQRTTSTTTSTSTIRPIPGVTSSAFDSNRLDSRPDESAQISVTIPRSPSSNEKSKRDATNEENESMAAEPLVSKLINTNSEIPLRTEYEVVKADLKPIETNHSGMILFEASDASHGPTGFSTPSPQTTFEDLTMSIINHARAISNLTTPLDHSNSNELFTNEINHKDEHDEYSKISETTLPFVAATEPSIIPSDQQQQASVESTLPEATAATSNDVVEAVTAAVVDDSIAEEQQTESPSELHETTDADEISSRSETTVSVDEV
ncbi:mucin-2-like, partial [Uranotaenia lowii]|uniref:mucin-2-like n=1 Tax=Uranotaenia lowii TaxID=190385 RepID=UPI002478DC5C